MTYSILYSIVRSERADWHISQPGQTGKALTDPEQFQNQPELREGVASITLAMERGGD